MTNLITYKSLRYFADNFMMLFLLFLVAFDNFFTNPVHNENSRLRLALVIPIGAPITVAKDAIETPPLVTDKSIKDLSK